VGSSSTRRKLLAGHAGFAATLEVTARWPVALGAARATVEAELAFTGPWLRASPGHTAAYVTVAVVRTGSRLAGRRPDHLCRVHDHRPARTVPVTRRRSPVQLGGGEVVRERGARELVHNVGRDSSNMWSGDFEIHLTCPATAVAALARFAVGQEVEFSHIELDQGTNPSQPMLTMPSRGTSAEALALAAQWRVRLEDAGLRVLRTKIEAAPWNDGVPELDEHARGDLYFEHHVKARLRCGDELALGVLAATARDHGGRPSRNARRRHTDGWEDRFVTQRCYGVGQRTATGRRKALVAAIRAGGFEVLAVQAEYVLYDDAVHLDAGWLEAGPTGTSS